MTDLNTMASNIKTVLETVPGIKQAYDHEPQAISQFPAATLYFDGFTQDDLTTNRNEVGWKWTVRLYLQLNTSDVKSPQVAIRSLLTDTLKELRKNINLNNSCLYHTVSNGDVFAILDQANPLMVVEFTLVATTRESIYG
ncbi:hypothetical protein RAH41_08165 [Gottfriedia acidiceleris]|uniref:hypothetical protein n=1 Tax=Gottfriedia acidiceleris TaxID=371036 RepID=UPI002F2645C0